MNQNFKINAKIKDRSYPIYIGNDNLDILSKLIDKSPIIIVVDEKVFKLHKNKLTNLKKLIKNKVEIIELTADEQTKSLKKAEELYHVAAKNNMTRSSWFLAIGGGVIGDLTGMVASTYMRGTNLIHIPTTLLAQVDSSIGGKVAVNYEGYKNLIGSFYQPNAVIADIDFLETLPKRELVSGLAEVIKYGILCDRELFYFIKDQLLLENQWNFKKLVKKSCEIKTNIVAKDEFDKGTRMLLNLGHTFAHALEGVTEYRYFKHGEAVMWGLVLSANLSYNLGILAEKELIEIKNLLNSIDLPKIPQYVKDKNLLFSHLLHDKKKNGNKLTVILPEKIGECRIYQCSLDEVLKVLLE
ncbi:3-dehydroquinate synthase [Natranaerobius trueperi]|uniref:3-dehydroquinate synthase n=1 Tax=Natranaerobius trueperi TaxID=759412 RepID=A0A226BZT1_9FIRM|nr:3-dehydroquinate synthase [Natranaerobius trueperi]OWZ83607.1 3-dehydroquinate synthase [Natranaerobius trueperi]